MMPVDPTLFPRFSGISTFSRLPHLPDPKKGEIQVGVIGIPFDGGTSFRPGARFGPRSLREASVLCRNYHAELEVAPYERLAIADVGDVAINPTAIEPTFQSIEKTYGKLLRLGVNLLGMGGDHSVLLPILRAHHKLYADDLVIIHFDAHTDTGNEAWGQRYHHGTPIRRAIEEKIIRGNQLFQIGIRGPWSVAQQMDFDKKAGINALTMDGFHSDKIRKDFLAKLKKTAQRKKVYITFDIDSIDPAYAPGTGTPVVGGLTSYEALTTLREFSGLDLIGGDVVEVSPPYDHAQITSLLGAAVLFEMMSLLAVRRSTK